MWLSVGVCLPVWKDFVCDAVFISTVDARRYLGVDVRMSQRSEWFALGFIPGCMITRRRRVQRREDPW